MPTHSLCRKCNGAGWIPYRSETVHDELEEAYRLCPNCYAPRRCMGSKTDHSCPRPGIVRYGLGYNCKEHIEVLYEGLGNLHEAVYYLRRWLYIARDRANTFLETQLSEALVRPRRG
jgi:hypothetical protein